MRKQEHARRLSGSDLDRRLLTEDVKSLGQQGEIVRVKPGYARNFLLPQGLAAVATEHNKRMVDRHKLRVADLQRNASSAPRPGRRRQQVQRHPGGQRQQGGPPLRLDRGQRY